MEIYDLNILILESMVLINHYILNEVYTIVSEDFSILKN